MRKSVLIAATMVVLTGVAYAASSQMFPSGSWRYKMTVIVETPEGLKTGSAVREVTAKIEPRVFGTTSHPRASYSGEAVVVDLGPRGVLFALMKSPILGVDYGYNVVFHAFPSPMPPLTPEGMRYYSALKTGKEVLHPVFYPMFVRFRDMKDPQTVESLIDVGLCRKKDSAGGCAEEDSYVSPQTMREHYYVKADRFEEVLGEGVRIREVMVEMTEEPVTWGIEKWLPWLPERKNTKGYLGRKVNNAIRDETKLYLTGIEFSKGRF